MKPEEALSYYNIEGAVEKIAPFGLGHINDTYLVQLENQDLLLQRINTSIFKNTKALEHNLKLVFDTASDLFPSHFKTNHGNYHLQEHNEVWRLQKLITNSDAPAFVDGTKTAFQIGLGFGQFTHKLIEIDANQAQEAIPEFLNLGLRIEKFEDVVYSNPLNRNAIADELIQKALGYRWIKRHFMNLIKKGLPERVCHNDTKSTNILLDKSSGKFLKVIDLDTIGPGHVMFDFGDMIRSMATHAEEDSRDTLNSKLRPELIEANRKGYLEACGSVLTDQEIESLNFGTLYMTYFTGVRMLTDYLEGDIYYRIEQADDNLVRARNQFYVLDLLSAYFNFNNG